MLVVATLAGVLIGLLLEQGHAVLVSSLTRCTLWTVIGGQLLILAVNVLWLKSKRKFQAQKSALYEGVIGDEHWPFFTICATSLKVKAVVVDREEKSKVDMTTTANVWSTFKHGKFQQQPLERYPDTMFSFFRLSFQQGKVS